MSSFVKQPLASVTSFLEKENALLEVFGLLTTFCLLSGIAFELYFLAVIPPALLLIYVTLINFKHTFFLLAFLLPLSTELELGGGFSTDFPAEFLMIGLTGVYFLYFLKNGRNLSAGFFRHPLTLLFLLHLGWMFLTMITSNEFFISLKFMLAKIWYVTVFYFMAGIIFKTKKDVQIFIWAVFIPMLISVIAINYQHAAFGFSFAKINAVVHPFYRNHVDYACIMALFFPVIWLAASWYRRWSIGWWILVSGILVLLIAIYFSYTRAAYAAIFIALGAFFIIRFRLMKIALAVTAIGASIFLINLSTNNTYLEYAPDYNKTITHKDFGNLLEATAKGEDISTMERVHRWVAGFQMIKVEPLLGFGPGTFVSFYERFTVTSFRTYVSDNPERSGIHSYYFMTMVEQGIPGILIFLLLIASIPVKGEQVYHQTQSPDERRIVLMALLCIVVIDALLIINDMLETDKVGPFFFISMAWIVNQDLRNKATRNITKA